MELGSRYNETLLWVGLGWVLEAVRLWSTSCVGQPMAFFNTSRCERPLQMSHSLPRLFPPLEHGSKSGQAGYATSILTRVLCCHGVDVLTFPSSGSNARELQKRSVEVHLIADLFIYRISKFLHLLQLFGEKNNTRHSKSKPRTRSRLGKLTQNPVTSSSTHWVIWILIWIFQLKIINLVFFFHCCMYLSLVEATFWIEPNFYILLGLLICWSRIFCHDVLCHNKVILYGIAERQNCWRNLRRCMLLATVYPKGEKKNVCSTWTRWNTVGISFLLHFLNITNTSRTGVQQCQEHLRSLSSLAYIFGCMIPEVCCEKECASLKGLSWNCNPVLP